MPIEIREVILRARVSDEGATPDVASIDLEELKREILIECEERIMAALRKQSDR